MESEVFKFLSKAKAGFPSPANDYLEPDLDYNAYLKKHPSATFSFRVEGESMKDAFIPHGSIIVVDRSIKPFNNCIVVASLDGEMIIKHIVKTKDGMFLMPANPQYKSQKVEEGMDFKVWGIVTHVIIDVIKS